MSLRPALLATSLLGVLLLLGPAARAQQATLKLAVCDFQQALQEVEEGKKAKANLEKRYGEKKAQVEKKRDQVQAMKDSLDAQRPMLTPQALEQKEKDLQSASIEYQQMVLESQQEMAQMEQQLTSGILEKLYGVAEKIGKDQGYAMIFEAQAVVYHAPAHDITPQVIAAYNSGK